MKIESRYRNNDRLKCIHKTSQQYCRILHSFLFVRSLPFSSVSISSGDLYVLYLPDVAIHHQLHVPAT